MGRISDPKKTHGKRVARIDDPINKTESSSRYFATRFERALGPRHSVVARTRKIGGGARPRKSRDTSST
jgi:hypothetical protein